MLLIQVNCHLYDLIGVNLQSLRGLPTDLTLQPKSSQVSTPVCEITHFTHHFSVTSFANCGIACSETANDPPGKLANAIIWMRYDKTNKTNPACDGWHHYSLSCGTFLISLPCASIAPVGYWWRQELAIYSHENRMDRRFCSDEAIDNESFQKLQVLFVARLNVISSVLKLAGRSPTIPRTFSRQDICYLSLQLDRSNQTWSY